MNRDILEKGYPAFHGDVCFKLMMEAMILKNVGRK